MDDAQTLVRITEPPGELAHAVQAELGRAIRRSCVALVIDAAKQVAQSALVCRTGCQGIRRGRVRHSSVFMRAPVGQLAVYPVAFWLSRGGWWAVERLGRLFAIVGER